MKKTFTVLFLGIGLFSIPFSYCSTTTTASTSSAGSGLATHDPDRAAAIEDANSHWYDIRPCSWSIAVIKRVSTLLRSA
jgi:hypothetical protein